MKIMVDKKVIERTQLERFKGIYKDFPVGDICEGEEPDFIVSNENGCIGIELTCTGNT